MTDRAVRWLLGALVVVSLALRAWHSSVELDSSHHYDEQFALRNVQAVVVEHTLKPSNGFYPALSYWPQTAVVAASEGLFRLTGQRWLTIFGQTADGFSPTAYFLFRLVNAVWGVLSLVALYALGKRFFDARVGLLAAAFLAAMPPHLAHSALFKPDILVVLLVALGFSRCLDAVAEPTRARYAWAGAWVGLAVSAKYTGVSLAIPLVAGSLFLGWKELRRWRWLFVAGAVSVGVFLVLNPYMPVVLRYLPRLWRIAEGKAEIENPSSWTIAQKIGVFLVEHHTRPVFVLVVIGLVLFILRAVDSKRPRLERLPFVMMLAYVLGYSALWIALGKGFRGQYYMPVYLFTSLAAAWAAIRGWDALARRWPALSRPVAVVTALAVALVLVTAPTFVLARQAAVPATIERAERLLNASLPYLEQRVVYFERGEEPMRPKRKGNPMVAIPVSGLEDVPETELDLADAELFYADRLKAPSGVEAKRLALWQGSARRIPSSFFSARGPELVVLLHPWRRLADPEAMVLERDAGRGQRFTARAAAPLAAGETVSLVVRMPVVRGVPRPKTLEIDGRTVALFELGNNGKRVRYLTARFTQPLAVERLGLRFPPTPPLEAAPEVNLLRWLPPER